MSAVPTVSTPPKPRTYGVGHKPKQMGLWKFGPVGSIILTVGSFICIILVLLNAPTGFAVAAVFAVVMLVSTIKDQHDKSYLDRINTRVAFRRHVHKSGNRKEGAIYQPGVLTHLGSHKLPGVLAESRLHEFLTTDDSTFTILEYGNTFVVAVSCDPDGAGLFNDADTEASVARYGDWLSNLAYDPDLLQLAVTVETAPDGGATLRHEVESHRSDRASDLSAAVMDAVTAKFPEAASASQAWATFTFRTPKVARLQDGTKAKKQPVQVIAEALMSRLPHLLADMPETGAGAVQPLNAQELIKVVRCAYNPLDRKMFDQIEASGVQPPVLDWDHAGPTATRTTLDRYIHSGCTSMTWETTGHTTSQVLPRSLVPLLEGHADVMVSRTTLLYQMIDPAHSAVLAETDHRAAQGRVMNSKKPAARDLKQVSDADNARADEAHGSALVNYAILHTATVPGVDERAVAAAASAVNRLGPTARLRMRQMHGVEDSGFAAALGVLGLVPSEHLSIATTLKNGL